MDSDVYIYLLKDTYVFFFQMVNTTIDKELRDLYLGVYGGLGVGQG